MRRFLLGLLLTVGCVASGEAFTTVFYVPSSTGTVMPGTLYLASGTISNFTTGTLNSTGTVTFANAFSSMTITTLSNQTMAYRRPLLKYVSGTEVDVETGTVGIAGQATVIFPDGSVYNETQAALLAGVISSTANWGNGTMTGGIRPSEKQTNNMWEEFYAVKSTATLPTNTTDFVVVMSTWAPLVANYAQLNTNFCGTGTNCWEYLGVVPYGDNSGAPNAFPRFRMAGHLTALNNVVASNSTGPMIGVRLATTAGAVSLSWAYANGNVVSSAQVPYHLQIGSFETSQTGSTTYQVTDSGSNLFFAEIGTMTSHAQVGVVPMVPLIQGLNVIANGSTAQDITLIDYIDNALGVGSNPQL